MSDLKPCPFCGSEAKRFRYFGHGESVAEGKMRHLTYCGNLGNCPATNTASADSQEQADKNWNMRTE